MEVRDKYISFKDTNKIFIPIKGRRQKLSYKTTRKNWKR